MTVMANAHVSAALWPTGLADAESVSDRELLGRFVTHRDEGAFSALVQRYGRLVWGVCRRFLHTQQDAEDAFQAVFLVLARKAGSIRKGEAVGSWLYGVAFRIALRAKKSSTRRQEFEKQAKHARVEDSPQSEAACRELQRVLDEEVMRLKDKYREPFILCCLEGMSKAEAAKELGCKEGTISGRLARARKFLQTRLAKRGFTLSAALTAVVLAHGAAWAAAPAPLMQATAQAVLASSAGATSLPHTVVTLADTYLRRARLATVGLIAALLVALMMTMSGAGLTAVYYLRLGDSSPEAAEIIDPLTFVSPGVGLGTPVGEQVLTVAFSQDGKRLATAGAWSEIPGQLKIWDAGTAEQIVAKSRIPGVRSVAFAPDDKSLATGDFNGMLTLRDPLTLDEIESVKAHPGGVGGVAFSPNGELLASAGLDQLVKLWRTAGLQEQMIFRGHADKVLCVAFFRNGQLIVSGSQDRTVKIWDVQTGEVKFTLEGHDAAVEAVALSPDDQLLATASPDSTVILWNAQTGEKLAELESDKKQPLLAVAFSRDGAMLAAGGRDAIIQLWDVKTRTSLGTLEKHKAPVRALAFSRENVLASGSEDTTAKLWPMGKGKNPRTLSTRWSGIRPVRAAVYSPDGSVLAVSTGDMNVHIRDAKVGDIIKVLHGHTSPVNALAFSPDGRTLASAGEDRAIKLWDWASGDELRSIDGHTDAIYALAYSLDGRKLFSAGGDKVIRIWDAHTGDSLGMWNGHDGAIRGLAISPNGQSLASAGDDDAIKIWEIATGVETQMLKGHLGPVFALAYSSDGLLASAGEDETVRLWDLAEAKERLTLKGHVGAVRALAFSPRGRTLVSAGKDGLVRVWDPQTGLPRAALKGHKDVVTALAMHPHGQNVVSGSLDTLLLRWKGRTEKLGPVAPSAKKIAAADEKLLAALVEDTQEKTQDAGTKKIDEEIKTPKKPKLSYGTLIRSFKDKPGERFGLESFGPDADKCVTFDAEGLRIALPTGYKGERPKTGVISPVAFTGDFEVTITFEILKEPVAEETGKDATRLSLGIDLQGPTKNVIAYSRRMGLPGGGSSLVTWSSAWDAAENKDQVTVNLHASAAKPARMKLARQGDEISFFVSEALEGDFELLDKRKFSDAEVREVRITGCTAGENAALEFRVHELRIRALTFRFPPKATPPQTMPVVVPKDLKEPELIDLRNVLKAPTKLTFTRAEAENFAKADDQGLRITMPAIRGSSLDAGVELPTKLRGDFEITLPYELLSVPVPGPIGGAGAILHAHFDTPDAGIARISRTSKNYGSTFGSNYMARDESGKHVLKGLNFPRAVAAITTGRLRLTRAGPTVAYLVSEGNGGFRIIATKEVGDADVNAIRALVTAGNQPVAVDVRFGKLEIRSAATGPDGVAITPVPTGEQAAPDAGSRILVVASFGLVLLILLLMVAAAVLIYFLRRRPRVEAPPPVKESAPSVPATPVIFFACTVCGKNLSVKASLAGKKVKCRRCGKATIVPAPDPEEGEIPVV